MNPYKNILKTNLPKLFSLYNLDSYSSTYGYGDRLYWGWKISDFANGTLQGGVHALAIAIKLELIESPGFVLKVIDSAIKAIAKIRAKNGSLVEAYPNEHSFCVTALVAFDVLSAIRHLRDHISPEQKKEYLNIIRPLIRFITHNDEEHAIISNHLATVVAAIELWNALSGEKSGRGKELMGIIYSHQSEEGWFREYDGADPGYQTLCTYYLFCAYEITEDERLFRSLQKSAAFLKYFAHPDGTIGGLYGSRNTEVYYPAGVVALTSVSDDFALIACLLHKGVLEGNHIFPQDVDIGNFTVLLNAYAVAAVHYEKCRKAFGEAQYLAPYENVFSKNFKHAGIYIRSTSQYYAIINHKKGGALKVFNKNTARINSEDGGLFGRLANGKSFSTQQFDQQLMFNDHTLNANFYITNELYLSPLNCILLRLLGIMLFRSIPLGNAFKKFIVKKLITGKKKIDGRAVRHFDFLENKIVVHETITKPRGCVAIGHFGKCTAIHMASSGYYLRQDEQVSEMSKIVEFKLEYLL